MAPFTSGRSLPPVIMGICDSIRLASTGRAAPAWGTMKRMPGKRRITPDRIICDIARVVSNMNSSSGRG